MPNSHVDSAESKNQWIAPKIAVAILLISVVVMGIGLSITNTVQIEGQIQSVQNITGWGECSFLGGCHSMQESILYILTPDHAFTATVECQNYWKVDDTVLLTRTSNVWNGGSWVLHGKADPVGVVGQCGSLAVQDEGVW